MRTNVRLIRSASLAVLLGFCVLLAGVGQGQAREFEIDGTADCGLKSSKTCDIDNTLRIWTDDISGNLENVEVDIRWVKDKLDKIEQDDHVCLTVEDRGGGRLRAVGIGQRCNLDGTYNPGLTTGDKKVSEQPKKAQDDDHDNTYYAPSVTPTVTGTPPTATPISTPGPTPTSTPVAPPGTITGIVTNALTGAPISGATVSVDGSTATTTTGTDGRFTLTAVPSGSQVLRTVANGFVTETRTVVVPASGTIDQSIPLTPGRGGGQVTIVLSWGALPQDLDAHLSGPDRSGGRFHVYFANRTAPTTSPYINLDVDDQTSNGPETITISRDSTTGNFVAGEYRYWVHNFSGEAGFDASNGRVTVNQGGSQLNSFSTPGGSTNLAIWRVVNLTIDAAGNVSLTPVQTYTTGFSQTPFGIPEGSVSAPTVK